MINWEVGQPKLTFLPYRHFVPTGRCLSLRILSTDTWPLRGADCRCLFATYPYFVPTGRCLSLRIFLPTFGPYGAVMADACLLPVFRPSGPTGRYLLTLIATDISSPHGTMFVAAYFSTDTLSMRDAFRLSHSNPSANRSANSQSTPPVTTCLNGGDWLACQVVRPSVPPT